MKALVTMALAGLLAACGGIGRQMPPTEVYDFGRPAARLPGSGPWSALALEVRAAPWLDTPAIAYRLLYENPLKLRAYAGSRWAGAPTQLLAQRLQQQLALPGNGSRSTARCLLRLELQEFSQVFASPRESRATLQAAISLHDANRRRVAEHLFDIDRPAVAADARAGTMALVAAGDELGRQVVDWLNDAQKHGRLEICRSMAGSDE